MKSDKASDQSGIIEKQKTSRLVLFKRFWEIARKYRLLIGFILLLGLLQGAVPMITPLMTRVLIDDVLLLETADPFWTLNKVVLVMGCLFILGIITQFIRNIVVAMLGNQLVIDIRARLYKHLQGLSQRFYDSRQVGGIVSRVINDVNGAQQLVGGPVINLVIELMMVFAAITIMYFLSPLLTLIAIFLLPFYYLTFTNFNVRIRSAWRSVHRQLERISGVMVESVSGMKVVQSFNREEREHERFMKQAKNHYEYAMSAHILAGWLNGFTQTFTNISGLLIWFVGGTLVINDSISLGTLISFQMFMGLLYGPIQHFSNVNVTIQNALTNVERIFEFLDVVPEIVSKEDAIRIGTCDGEIEFENVHYTYVTERPEHARFYKNGDPDLVQRARPEKSFYWIPPKSKPDPPPVREETQKALKGVNFKAKAGEVIALVGPSGAGKSTLIHFIPRFLDPDKGVIRLDGEDIRNLNVDDLRKQIALVLQDNTLFSGTVWENISYGRPEATKEEVMAAAKAAYAHEFIMDWEKGYDTVMGERGVRLSGGQKQRVAIARALLKDPRILILDEATSSLDAESESLVTEALEVLMEGRTTFIIAHRLATVVRADQILVLDDGQIVERGSHEELLKANGKYRELYEKQLKAMRPEEMKAVET